MNSKKRFYGLLATAALCFFVVSVMAQDTSQTSVSKEEASQEIQMESAEVIYVSGNDLILKTNDGQIRHVTVPEGATATVDGKQVTIQDVKPGMVLQRTLTTTTTPEVVTTVRTIKGKVWQVTAPLSVILTLGDGTNKQYKVPKDQKFIIDGEEKTVWDLKKGMNVTATVITQVPQVVVAHEKQVTGKMPSPPATPPMQGALLIEEPAKPAPVVVQAAEKTELPKTASMVPLIGLLGLLSLAGSFGLNVLRRIR